MVFSENSVREFRKKSSQRFPSLSGVQALFQPDSLGVRVYNEIEDRAALSSGLLPLLELLLLGKDISPSERRSALFASSRLANGEGSFL